jgi:hypothetical protein
LPKWHPPHWRTNKIKSYTTNFVPYFCIIRINGGDFLWRGFFLMKKFTYCQAFAPVWSFQILRCRLLHKLVSLCWDLEKLLHFVTHCCDPFVHLLPRFSAKSVKNTIESSKNLRQINTHKNCKNWDKSTHSQIATKTETKINTHKNCKKNLDKSQHT